jgi:tetratricopeptide (TPR) repeat protein
MLLTALLFGLLQIPAEAPPAPQAAVDPALRAAVERFFAMQEAEDVAGYLALWSKSAQLPQAQQLKFIFDTGDDKFTDLTIERAAVLGTQARVRIRVFRARTGTRPDGTPTTFNTRLLWTLTFVREGEEWKVLREGTPIDELALALIVASTAEERKALLDAEPDLLNDRLLDSMSRRGDAEAQKTMYGAAEKIYERVLEIAQAIGSRRGEGQALQNLGNSYYFQRKYPAALEMFQRRLAIERESANQEGIASALAGVGSVHYATFEYSASLASYREAAAILEKLDDKMSLASALISTGNVLYLQGDLEGAITDYRRSRELYRGFAYKAGEARALEGLGLVLTAQGDLAGALDAYGGVLEEGRARNDPRGQATAHFSIGEIHFMLGNLDTARAQFEQSRGFYSKTNDFANVGRSWQGIALTDLVAARFAAAEQGYVKSQEACAANDDQACVARAMVGLAFAQSSQEHFDKAIGTYGHAIAAFTKLADGAQAASDKRGFLEDAARAEIGLAQALAGKKDHKAGLAAAARAYDRAVALSSGDVLWRALAAQARALRRLGEVVPALAAAREAVATIDRLKLEALTRPDARIVSDSVAAYGILAVLQAEARDDSAVFNTTEQRRGHALRLALAVNEREIHRGMTSEERAEERALAGELVALNVQRDRQKALPKPDTERLARLDTAITDVRNRRAAQQQRLFERLPDLRRWRALEPPATVDVLPAALKTPGSVILQFVIDEDDVLVMTAVASEDGPLLASHVSPITRQKLAERVAALNDAAALRDFKAWSKAALEVAAVLPPSVLKTLAASRAVVIVPDDVLWRVPFEALPLEDRYLADFVTVTYAGSVTAFMAPTQTAVDRPAVPLVGVGAPELAASIRERLKATAPDWTLRAPQGAERELKAAAALYAEPAAVVQLGAAATEPAFRSDAERAALLHIAAPFRTNSASPLFSPLLLTTAAEERPENAADGVLEAREIMNLRLRARTAVLTDGTAMSMRNAAAVLPTLQWTWLAAGVPALILPRWVGDDAASDALIAELHARLKAGDSPADALQAARMKVRKAENTVAPYFWAGWMLVGK